VYACSPRWSADWISEEDLDACLSLLSGKISPSPWGEEAVSLNHGLHFTGGEPFLQFELLVKAVEKAAELQIPSTFVETNCFWCLNDETTTEKLRFLSDAGLKGIMISVNPYYAEYVPFERTERCVRLSEIVFGSNVMVYQMGYYQRFRQLGVREKISIEQYLELTRDESLAETMELFLMGRAARCLRELYPAYPGAVFLSEPCQPPFFRNWHNHFDNYGNLMPGYCGGISLGSWRELNRLVKEGIHLEERPVLKYLIAGDMEGLLRFAMDFGYHESRHGYISKCDLCLDIRKFLVAENELEELAPREFYERLD